MKNIKYNSPNCLKKYRRRKELSQKKVAHILKMKNSSLISRWENSIHPTRSLIFLIKLNILYRTSTGALFPELYRIIKNEIFSREEELDNTKQNENQTN